MGEQPLLFLHFRLIFRPRLSSLHMSPLRSLSLFSPPPPPSTRFQPAGVTSVSLEYKVSERDNNKSFACRAENKRTGIIRESPVILKVLYGPKWIEGKKLAVFCPPTTSVLVSK